MLPTVNNDLFKVEGGNAQVPEQLLQHASVQLCNASVTHIIKSEDGTFQVKATGKDTPQVSEQTKLLNGPECERSL